MAKSNWWMNEELYNEGILDIYISVSYLEQIIYPHIILVTLIHIQII